MSVRVACLLVVLGLAVAWALYWRRVAKEWREVAELWKQAHDLAMQNHERCLEALGKSE